MAHRFVVRSLGTGSSVAGPGISQGSFGGAAARVLCVHVPGAILSWMTPPDSVIEVKDKVPAYLLPPVLHPSQSPAGHPSNGGDDVRALWVPGSTVEDVQLGDSFVDDTQPGSPDSVIEVVNKVPATVEDTQPGSSDLVFNVSRACVQVPCSAVEVMSWSAFETSLLGALHIVPIFPPSQPSLAPPGSASSTHSLLRPCRLHR